MTGARPIVNDDRQEAHGQLVSVVRGHLANGRSVPCTDLSAAWAWTTEDDPEAEDQAATLCLGCPALRDCEAYVTAHKEVTGVWAAMTPKQRRKHCDATRLTKGTHQ